MIKSILFFLILVLLCGGTGCRSSNTHKEPHGQSPDSTGTDTAPHQRQGAPAAIARNASHIEATVDSLILLDSLEYRLHVSIIAVHPTETMPSLAEPGQKVALSPSFVLTENGTVDGTNERNGTLLAVRSLKPGDTFTGSITLLSSGGWVIVAAGLP